MQNPHQQQAALALTQSPAYQGSLRSVVVLSGSRFLKPAQQLLDDVCAALRSSSSAAAADIDAIGASDSEDLLASAGPRQEHRRPKLREEERAKLHDMHQELQYMGTEVCKRYHQHRQQMQMVVSSFESVPGLSSATPYASSALNAVSKRFGRLSTMITKKSEYISRLMGEPEGCSSGGKATAITVYHQKPGVWKARKGQHPERALSVLRAWLFDNFLHPYPSTKDKQMLAKRTGLSQKQVSNWFGNARGRLWEPMVDEMHRLETLSSSSRGGGHQQSC